MSESWQCEFCGMPACDCPVGRYRDEIATLRGRAERLRQVVVSECPIFVIEELNDEWFWPGDLDDNLTEPST